jgi:hypothetical protein
MDIEGTSSRPGVMNPGQWWGGRSADSDGRSLHIAGQGPGHPTGQRSSNAPNGVGRRTQAWARLNRVEGGDSRRTGPSRFMIQDVFTGGSSSSGEWSVRTRFGIWGRWCDGPAGSSELGSRRIRWSNRLGGGARRSGHAGVGQSDVRPCGRSKARVHDTESLTRDGCPNEHLCVWEPVQVGGEMCRFGLAINRDRDGSH